MPRKGEADIATDVSIEASMSREYDLKMEKERFVLKFRFMLSSVTNRGYGRSVFLLIFI